MTENDVETEAMAHVVRRSQPFIRQSDYGKRSWIKRMETAHARAAPSPRTHSRVATQLSPPTTKGAAHAAIQEQHNDHNFDANSINQRQSNNFETNEHIRVREIQPNEKMRLVRNYPQNVKDVAVQGDQKSCCSTCNALQSFVYQEAPANCPCKHFSTGFGGGFGSIIAESYGKWRDYDVESVDSNFIITRVFTARFCVVGDTFFYRVHVCGTLIVDDESITLSFPQHVESHCAVDGGDDQFGIALVSGESENFRMFAPIQIQPASSTLIVNQQALRSGVIYDIYAQGFIEIK